MTIINEDCLIEMRKMESNSISAIVTDPPYGIGFMGKKWDLNLPHDQIWKEALRISKPGSFLIAFGGTRTFHRLTCAIEEAGWEIRDCLMWLYGSGFPKSHNHFGLVGYGTALKPAWEPIIMAMKPCDGTFMQNVEKWGQGGINIDDCRIPLNKEKIVLERTRENTSEGWDRLWMKDKEECKKRCARAVDKANSIGRWPANLLLDEESSKLLDKQSGNFKNSNLNEVIGSSGGASRFFYCAKASTKERNEGCEGLTEKIGGGLNSTVKGDTRTGHKSYHKNNHPTVKPIKLMEYLIKLVMPPKNGILLDPFAGSGTTLIAAQNLGINVRGIEKDEGYCEIAKKRIEYYKNKFIMESTQQLEFNLA